VFVEEFHQFVDRCLADIQLGDDLGVLMGLLVELCHNARHVFFRAGQDQALFKLALAKPRFHPSPHDFFLENHQQKADSAKENDD
jgi:hypothetical protein